MRCIQGPGSQAGGTIGRYDLLDSREAMPLPPGRGREVGRPPIWEVMSPGGRQAEGLGEGRPISPVFKVNPQNLEDWWVVGLSRGQSRRRPGFLGWVPHKGELLTSSRKTEEGRLREREKERVQV